jgi:hypothetical protein
MKRVTKAADHHRRPRPFEPSGRTRIPTLWTPLLRPTCGQVSRHPPCPPEGPGRLSPQVDVVSHSRWQLRSTWEFHSYGRLIVTLQPGVAVPMLVLVLPSMSRTAVKCARMKAGFRPR